MPNEEAYRLKASFRTPGGFENSKTACAKFWRATHEELDHQLFEKNINVWEQNFPQVGAQLARMTPSQSYLLVNDAKEFNISFQNQPLLAAGAKSWALPTPNFSNFFQTQRLIDFPSGAEGLENEVLERVNREAEKELE